MKPAVWETPGDTSSIILTKTTGKTIRLAVGDFIIYKEREGFVRITSFTHKTGGDPIGMTYLPWRCEEKRWASISWSLRGDMRHIILPDAGPHCGQHIDWDFVEHCENVPPEAIN